MTAAPESLANGDATVDGPPSVAITDLDVAFGGNVVLRGVSLRFGPGFNGLIGPNGAGKTTVFNVISGYVKPGSGTVRIFGEDVVGRRQAAIAAIGIGRTFQSPKLVLDLSALDNVLLGMHARYASNHFSETLGLGGARRTEREARVRAMELLERFGMAGQATVAAGNLPLGSQKVLEVARALAIEPRLLMLDEPAAGLGATDVDTLLSGLRTVVEERQLCVVIIEHDLQLVMSLCPVVAVLHFGRIIALGSPAEVARNPEVVEAYLGASFAAEG
jgi:branched-chain amino acid transport system ATP-binding protein